MATDAEILARFDRRWPYLAGAAVLAAAAMVAAIWPLSPVELAVGGLALGAGLLSGRARVWAVAVAVLAALLAWGAAQ